MTEYQTALIELLFNSLDSYVRLNNPDKERLINIHVGATKISVEDFAEGMTSRVIRDHFLQIGTSDETASDDVGVRGFFKRGAKDITNIGVLEIESVSQSGLLSHVRLEQNLSFTFLEQDVPQPEGFKVGTKVTVFLSSNFHLNIVSAEDVSLIRENFRLHDRLRLVLAEPENIVNLQVGSGEFERVVYTFPPQSQVVYTLSYKIPGYEDVVAHYKVYKKTSKNQKITVHNQEYKNLVVDSSRGIVYDTTTFKSYLESHDQIEYFYGVLDCPYITELLHTWSYANNDPKNPILIVDPARINGVSIDHPFIHQLYSVAAMKFEILLQKSFYSRIDDFYTENNILELTENLSEIGNSIVASKDELMYWRSDMNGNMVRASRDVQDNYVLEEEDLFLDVLSKENGQEAVLNNGALQEFISYVSAAEKYSESQSIENGELQTDAETDTYVMAHSTSKKFEIKLTKFNDSFRQHLLMTSTKIILYVNKNNLYVQYMLGIQDADDQVLSASPTTKRFLMDVMVETLTKLLTEARILKENAFSDAQKESFNIYNNVYQNVQLEIEKRTFQSIIDNTVKIKQTVF